MNVFLQHECQEVGQSENLEMIQFSTVSSFISWKKNKDNEYKLPFNYVQAVFTFYELKIKTCNDNNKLFEIA